MAAVAALLVGLAWPPVAKWTGLDLRLLTDPDAVIKVAAALAGHRGDLTPVALLDIDEHAYAAWGAPAIVPRREALRLIEAAVAASAAAVVVDIDLARGRTEEQGLVAAALSAHAADRSRPPLFIVRGLARPAGRRSTPDLVSAAPSGLDPVVAGAANIRWVSAYFDADADWHYRNWRGAHVACDGAPRAYASVGLATVATRAEGLAGLFRLDAWLASLAAARCRGSRVPEPPKDVPWLRNAASPMPIPYLLGHTTEPAQFASTRTSSGAEVPVFVRFAALDVLEPGGLAPGALEGRVAIIGASHSDSRDLHRTPLGTMPGFYVLSNIIADAHRPLGEATIWGLRGYLLGLPLFALHLLATRMLRKIVAVIVVFAVTALATGVGITWGFSPYILHEAALTSLVLISLFALFESLAKTLEPGSRGNARAPLYLRAVLSDRALKAVVEKRGSPVVRNVTAAIFALALGIAWTTPATAQDLAGYVAGITSHSNGSVELRRGADPPRPLRLGENVLAGDLVTVRSPTRVRIDTAKGSVTLCSNSAGTSVCEHRFSFAGGRRPIDVLHRLSAVLSWFAAPQSNFGVRDDGAPRFALAAGIPQRVGPGNRELWVAWVGGEAPFRATIAARGHILSEMPVEAREVRFPRLPISNGAAEVGVTDAQGRRVALLFIVASPPPAQRFGSNAVNADHAALLAAVDLAQRDGGQWRLEAAQRVTDAADRVPAAAAFRRALAAGDRLLP